MKLRLTTLLLPVCAISGAALGALWAPPAAATQSPTVWDGIYTEEQALRGQQTYETACASCHGTDLSGGDEAPILSGGEFIWNWDGVTVGTLFERIRTSMPVEDPASVSRREKADILAYVLSSNDFPVGDAELASRTSVLERIMFEAIQR